MDKQEHGAWYALLDPRQQATVDHAITYALNYSHAGVPGHSAHLLIAKLATELDKATVGVQGGSTITAAVAPNAPINEVMSAIRDIAELSGWPCIDSGQADDNFAMQFKLGGL